MVPVPEEHAEEFRDELMRMALRDSMAKWTAPAVDQMLEELPAPWRALVVELTRRSHETWQADRSDVASAVGVPLAELVPMGAAINEHCKQRGWPHVVMAGEQHDRISGTTRKTIYLNHHAAELLVVALGEEAAPAS